MLTFSQSFFNINAAVVSYVLRSVTIMAYRRGGNVGIKGRRRVTNGRVEKSIGIKQGYGDIRSAQKRGLGVGQ
jgi:hypothetical protein